MEFNSRAGKEKSVPHSLSSCTTGAFAAAGFFSSGGCQPYNPEKQENSASRMEAETEYKKLWNQSINRAQHCLPTPRLFPENTSSAAFTTTKRTTRLSHLILLLQPPAVRTCAGRIGPHRPGREEVCKRIVAKVVRHLAKAQCVPKTENRVDDIVGKPVEES